MMELLIVIRIFVLAIFFNIILPTGDVYSDIILMIKTWNFRNAESIELIGCRACYGKTEEDLFSSHKDCSTCITKNEEFLCGQYYKSMNKLVEIENEDTCENQKWVVGYSFPEPGVLDVILEEGECDHNHNCCFETKNKTSQIEGKEDKSNGSLQHNPNLLIDCNNYFLIDLSSNMFTTCLVVGKAKGFVCALDVVNIHKNKLKDIVQANQKELSQQKFRGIVYHFILNHNSTDDSYDLIDIVPVEINALDERFECGLLIKPRNVNIIGDKVGDDCGLDSCKVHLDYFHFHLDGIYNLKLWEKAMGYDNGQIRVGGKNCHMLRLYAWSMVVPILINFLFNGVIFYMDVKSEFSTNYEVPFLLMLLYPQWRTLKILIKFLMHQNKEDLTNHLDENDKDVSFIEPFCESGFQVGKFSFSMCFSLDVILKVNNNFKNFLSHYFVTGCEHIT